MMHHDSRDTGHEVLLKMLGVNCLKPLLLFSFQYMSKPTCGQTIHVKFFFDRSLLRYEVSKNWMIEGKTGVTADRDKASVTEGSSPGE